MFIQENSWGLLRKQACSDVQLFDIMVEEWVIASSKSIRLNKYVRSAMENENELQITSEERIMAALAHGSVILYGFGLLASLAVWISQRGKSSWVRYQALQAMTYQVLQFAYYTAAIFISQCAFILIFIFTMEKAVETDSPQYFGFLFSFMLIPVLLIGLYYVVAILGAGLCLFGKDFRYPIIGRWVSRYLEPREELPEEDE